MKKVVFITVVLSIISAIVFAEDTLSIPAPAGSTLLTEINLSETDILGIIKQSIPAFVQGASGAKGELGQFLASADFNLLSDAIRDIKQIRIVQFQIPAGTDPTKTLEFYESSLPTGDGWSRVLYDASMIKKGAAAVYTRAGQDYFLIGVDPVKNRIFAARTIGFVDVPKLAAWAGNMARIQAEREAKAKAEAAKKAAQPSKSTPAKTTAKKTTTKK